MRRTVSERRDAILGLLDEKKAWRVSFLAKSLGVSPVTIRRDVEALEEEGRLRRGHGVVTVAGSAGKDSSAERERNAPRLRRPAAGTHQPLVGMLVPSVASYYAEVVRGARSALASAGGRLVLGVSNYRSEDEEPELERLLEAGIEGLLFTPTWPDGVPGEHDQLGPAVIEPKVPTVLVERRGRLGTASAALDWICTDHSHGAYLAVSRLVDQGRRRIALVARHSPTARHLKLGYEATLQEAGLLQPGSTYVETANDDASEFSRHVEHLLDDVESGDVDAAIVHGDVEAILLVQSAIRRGLQVPDDLAVVAYDDDIAEVNDLPLTAVAPPKFAVGWVATQVLLSRTEAARRGGRSLPVQHLSLQPQLLERSSS